MTEPMPYEAIPISERRAIPEDEMRAILGLPDVPEHIKVRARLRNIGQAWIQIGFVWAGLTEAISAAYADLTLTVGRWTLDPELPAAPDTRTPQQRALPRPSSTPPMWAIDHRRKGKAGRHGL